MALCKIFCRHRPPADLAMRKSIFMTNSFRLYHRGTTNEDDDKQRRICRQCHLLEAFRHSALSKFHPCPNLARFMKKIKDEEGLRFNVVEFISIKNYIHSGSKHAMNRLCKMASAHYERRRRQDRHDRPGGTWIASELHRQFEIHY